MLKDLIFDLQLFAEGGEGGDGGEAPAAGGQPEGAGEKIPAFIPEKAKKTYQKAMERMPRETKPEPEDKPQDTTAEEKAAGKISYEDLIKSEDYKDAHKAYMDKTIGERLKKYKGMEQEHERTMQILSVVANKYGVDINSERFLDELQGKIDEDDSYYEKYAVENDMTPEQARKIVTMERKVSQMEQREKQSMAQEAQRKQLQILYKNAEKTQKQFPEFNLETEMQDERFRKLCAVNNGDTTAAYMACHWAEVIPAQVQMATKQVQSQTAQAVAANQARPVENGIRTSNAAVVEQNFKGMDLKQLRAYAEEQRRLKSGR